MSRTESEPAGPLGSARIPAGTSARPPDGQPADAASGTPAAYFDAMYEHADDPWQLAERWYEQRKYDLTVAALPLPRYRRAFEPACSVGELTRRLAGRCDELLACDRVPAAVATARQRTAALDNVTVRRLTLPDQWPEGRFDLIVLSEVLYYFDAATLDRLLDRVRAALEPGGTLITAHWNHPVPDHVFTGADIADRLALEPELSLLADHRETDFLLQVHSRRLADGTRAPSPAEREGLV